MGTKYIVLKVTILLSVIAFTKANPISKHDVRSSHETDRKEVKLKDGRNVHVSEFADIARSLNIPNNDSIIIKDFLSKTLLELEKIAEKKHSDVFKRTFDGNAVVVRTEDLNRSPQLHDFFNQIVHFTKNEASKGSGGEPKYSSEVKYYSSEPRTFHHSSKSESFRYSVSVSASSQHPPIFHIEWTSTKQEGNSPPVVKKGSVNFIIDCRYSNCTKIVDKQPPVGEEVSGEILHHVEPTVSTKQTAVLAQSPNAEGGSGETNPIPTQASLVSNPQSLGPFDDKSDIVRPVVYILYIMDGKDQQNAAHLMPSSKRVVFYDVNGKPSTVELTPDGRYLKDSAEVAKAKAQHFAAFEAALKSAATSQYKQ